MANQQQPGGRASAQPGHGNVSASEVEQFIKGVDFPCAKEGLVEKARSNNAPQEVLSTIENFPDQEFGSPTDVARAISETKH